MTGNPQLAELMMQSRFHGAADSFRSRRPFSPDIEAVHAVLFSAKYDRQAKIRVYRAWLEKNQPCVFGKTAATNKNVYICLVEEHEVFWQRQNKAPGKTALQRIKTRGMIC
jgi:hypothetical protein